MTSQKSFERRNQVCQTLFKVLGPYAPPQAIISYWNGTEQRFVRAVEGISDRSMLLLVCYDDRMRQESGLTETFNEAGYEYVCRRIKSPEITAAECADLKRVKKAYDIMDEFRQLILAAKRGDACKVNRILSKGAMA